MYDTVNFWLDRVGISGGSPFDMLPYLTDITERQAERRGYSCSGRAGDYAVHIAENGVSLHGSLAKYHLGNNIDTLTKAEARRAVERLSDHLHTDISAARVTRVDVSTVIPVKRPPADYYSYLGQKAHFDRVQATSSTLYYNNHQRQLVMYDKTKEAHSAGVSIPEIFVNNHLFRYEYRLKARVSGQMKTEVTAATLTDAAFYCAVVARWRDEFKSISKINKLSINMERLKTPRAAKEAYFAMLLQGAGQQGINDFIADLKAANAFSDPKYYSRLKAEFNKIIEAPTADKSEMIQELESKIFTAAKYAM